MRTRIVQFQNGKYAVRKGLFWYRYLDLKTGTHWWEISGAYFYDCLTDDFEIVRRYGLPPKVLKPSEFPPPPKPTS